MEFFRKVFELLFGGLNDTAKWNALINHVGVFWVYVVLFGIVFVETGLVVMPFLPGDSLLFAIGAIGSREDIALNLPLVTVLLIIAAILGDAVNYVIGYYVGPAIFKKDTGRFLNKQHLMKRTPSTRNTAARRSSSHGSFRSSARLHRSSRASAR